VLNNKKVATVAFTGAIIFLLFFPSPLLAISEEGREQTFLVGFGTGTIPEGKYEPILLIWHLGFNLDRLFPSLRKSKGRLTFFIETQFNPSFTPEANYEFGISPGLKFSYPLTERLHGFLLVALGPHYISLVTTQQANGFIFSDTVGGGLSLFLGPNRALSIGYRFRHLSNAGLASPNGGINTHFVTLGLNFLF